jgi:hypothetical protein
MLSIILPILIVLIILGLAIWVIKRRFIDHKGINAGSQFVGRHVMMQFQDADKHRASEQIIQQEEERKQDFSADDKDAGTKLNGCNNPDD